MNRLESRAYPERRRRHPADEHQARREEHRRPAMHASASADSGRPPAGAHPPLGAQRERAHARTVVELGRLEAIELADDVEKEPARIADGQVRLERQALRTRGAAYRTYQRTTSAFIPWPRPRLPN